MSLRDDLDFMARAADYGLGAPDFLDAYRRLRAVLTPAAEKWLEALPGILDAKAKRVEATKKVVMSEMTQMDWEEVDNELHEMIEAALHEAAALHNAQDNKEQK